jgi:hypothetical protein
MSTSGGNANIVFDKDLMFYLDVANEDSYKTGSVLYDLTPNNKNVNKNSVTYDPADLGALSFNQTSFCSFVDFAPFNGVTYNGKTLIIVGQVATNFNTNIFSAPNYGFRQVFGAANAPGAAQRNWYFSFYNDGSGNGYKFHQSCGGLGTLSKSIPFNRLGPGSWFYAAFTHSTNGNYEYYFNGINIGKEYGANHTSTFFQPITLSRTELIGGGTNAFGGEMASWRGKVAAVMVYKRDLSAEEIMQNFRVLGPRYGLKAY